MTFVAHCDVLLNASISVKFRIEKSYFFYWNPEGDFSEKEIKMLEKRH